MERLPRLTYTFPKQRVSDAEKNNADWYANCIDYIISMGLSLNDSSEVDLKTQILHGNMPQQFYRKALNPYNASNEKYTRFPATMRNYDIITGIVRRYVSEYFKGAHEFIVGCNDPDVVINKRARFAEEVFKEAAKAFQQEMQKNYQDMVQQATQNGQSPDSINPKDAIPDQETFIKNFENKYIDDKSEQAAKVLNYVRAMTDDIHVYLTAYFNFVSYGQCYTYTTVTGNKIIKECVPANEAYPIPNNSSFAEDYDMFARRLLLSYEQIMDMFDEELEDRDRKYLEDYYVRGSRNVTRIPTYNDYSGLYPDLCSRFNKEDVSMFRNEKLTPYDENGNLYEVWHCVWKSWTRVAVVTYIDQLGGQSERIEPDGYKLNEEAGDISIDYSWKKTVYEGYRIGARCYGIYPIKARAIPFSRDWKLPYNGIAELLPGMGPFSLIATLTPFQVLRNIISYHREMVIAKNKQLVLMIPNSLIASRTEDKIYKMAADGVLIVDDDDDTSGVKMQQVRLLNANLGQYITELTNLIEAIKQDAYETIDMNPQRFGQITQSAGASTTSQAIAQSSMGSVIIETVFDLFRLKDYNRDIDYAKFAFIDGLDTGYTDPSTGGRRYISLDVNSFCNGEYSVTVRNSAKEIEKLQQLRQWAFSAAQNGDLDMALNAIVGDNVSQIKKLIQQATQLKQQHENDLKQADQMLEQTKQQNELDKIRAKGEEDRKTEAVKHQYSIQEKYVDIDGQLLMDGTQSPDDNTARDQLAAIAEQNKVTLEQQKLNVKREEIQMDTYNKAADRQVKREDMANRLKIARTNKNRYDKK